MASISFPSSVTIGEAQRTLTACFAAAGLESPGLDARLLLQAASGRTREQLVVEPAFRLSSDQSELLSNMATRRLAHEPVSRILGERAFWGRLFEITPATLDPRPDTETLVQLALDLAHEEGWTHHPLRILDIGTGTGCILVTLLAELPHAHGTGVDISAAALAVAARNASRHAVSARTVWRETSVLDGIAGPFELIVSNPPYIPTAAIAALDPGVRAFDPRQALDGGPDGLGFYRRIVSTAPAAITPGGWCAVEVGAEQADAVMDLIERQSAGAGISTTRTRRDLGNHTRCVAWKPHPQM